MTPDQVLLCMIGGLLGLGAVCGLAAVIRDRLTGGAGGAG